MLLRLLFMLLKFSCFIASWSSCHNLYRCVTDYQVLKRCPKKVMKRCPKKSVSIKSSRPCKYEEITFTFFAMALDEVPLPVTWHGLVWSWHQVISLQAPWSCGPAVSFSGRWPCWFSPLAHEHTCVTSGVSRIPMTSWKHTRLTSCGSSPSHWYYDNLKSGLLTVTCRQSTPGPGHCSNTRQLNCSRKGHLDSHARVQTVQAGQGPGGWTRRRALGCHCYVAAAPGRPRCLIWHIVPYIDKTFDIEEKNSISLYPDIAQISCKTSKFYLWYLYILTQWYCNTIS